jgi:hypothetical protein
MLVKEASMDDGSLFNGPSGTGAGAEGCGPDQPRDRICADDQSLVRVEMDEAQSRDRLCGSGSSWWLQAPHALGRMCAVAARTGCLWTGHSAGPDSGASRTRDQDPAAGSVGLPSRRGPELQKKRCCPRSRCGRTWRENARSGRLIND